jgi:CDP-glucose 4,6-dehydratase
MTADQLEHCYRGRSVLVTGDTGFKGTWLSLLLQTMGARVTGFALPPERSDDFFVSAAVGDLIHHRNGDIRDVDALKRTFEDSQPEIVFHLAAQALVRRSYEEPKMTFDTNVGGSTNVLECVLRVPSVRALIYVTSDKCYRNREWIWGYREGDELGGHDPYSASKAAAELVFSSYLDSFFRTRKGFGAASVRAGNVIGGGDWSTDRIVPDCIRSLRDKKVVVLRNPEASRPWQHVLDPLHGYLMLGARLVEDAANYSGAWNFGPNSDSTRTVMDLASRIIKAWGSGNITVNSVQSVHEAGTLHLNCDKAHRVLKWSPTWNFERAVDETVRWYAETASGRSARDTALLQIAAYKREAT